MSTSLLRNKSTDKHGQHCLPSPFCLFFVVTWLCVSVGAVWKGSGGLSVFFLFRFSFRRKWFFVYLGSNGTVDFSQKTCIPFVCWLHPHILLIFPFPSCTASFPVVFCIVFLWPLQSPKPTVYILFLPWNFLNLTVAFLCPDLTDVHTYYYCNFLSFIPSSLL